MKTASIIFAAGKGSRMKGTEVNKTLLPLIAGRSPYEGRHPILRQILSSLPPGPKALVINYKKEEVVAFASSLGLALTFCEQPSLNGTGGALLAAKGFLGDQPHDRLIITMGDIPLVRASTYHRLFKELEYSPMVVLGFRPSDRKQYGVLEKEGRVVKRIVEWKYWRSYSEERQTQLDICNSGIYAARKEDLLRYLPLLEARPHRVLKEREGKMVEIEEFFITDLVEFMHAEGQPAGFVLAEDEEEVMGVDDLPSLKQAQRIFMDRYPTEFQKA